MKPGPIVLMLALGLGACKQPVQNPTKSSQRALREDEKIVRATLALLAADGKPVCVERQTFGSPLSIYRIARQGKLETIYPLAWFPARPFRPPHMPNLDELRKAARDGRNAGLPEAPARKDELPEAQQTDLDTIAMALAPPEIPAHRASIRDSWAPKGVVPRWWPANSPELGCTAQYVVSGVKWNAHVAFAAVRVDHWGTVYALAKRGDDWRPIAQWGSWLY